MILPPDLTYFMSVVRDSIYYTTFEKGDSNSLSYLTSACDFYKIGRNDMQLMYQVGCGLRKYLHAMHIYSWMTVLTYTINVVHTMNPTIVVVIDKYILSMVTNYQKLKERLPV